MTALHYVQHLRRRAGIDAAVENLALGISSHVRRPFHRFANSLLRRASVRLAEERHRQLRLTRLELFRAYRQLHVAAASGARRNADLANADVSASLRNAYSRLAVELPRALRPGTVPFASLMVFVRERANRGARQLATAADAMAAADAIDFTVSAIADYMVTYDFVLRPSVKRLTRIDVSKSRPEPSPSRADWARPGELHRVDVVGETEDGSRAALIA